MCSCRTATPNHVLLAYSICGGLQDAAKEDPGNPAKYAAWLNELNKSDPAAVLAAVNAKKEAVNSSVVVDYIQALVKTREIERFRVEAPTAAGTEA